MRPLGGSDRRRKRRLWPWLVVAALIGLGLSLRAGGKPVVELSSDLPGIGPRTTIEVVAREPRRGLVAISVVLAQGEREIELGSREFEPLPVWKFWGDRTAETALRVEVGSEVTDGLVEGEATVSAVARGARTWLRRSGPTTAELRLPVRLKPPRVGVVSTQHYPTQGGSEAVVYTLGDGVARHGVRAGDAFFPGFPLPGGGTGQAFALFAVPHDLPADATIRLVVEDDVGNRAETAFVDRLRPREGRHDTIRLSDEFMARVAPQIEARTPELDGEGSLVERYLAINSRLRVENRREIARLAESSAPEMLWSGAFLPMPNGQVMARFGDRRTYLYEGEEVDRQDHLGYDLASVQRAPVPAANSGRVVMADFLGIYGNVVVIDHGFGLMSLYGHLSTMEVAPGARVEKRQTIGHTGATGLAGGDHLHFGIFLHGVATDPVEWLDPDWIRNRVLDKLRSPA